MSRRIRSLKPEWLDDSRIARMSDHARLLSLALMMLADDYGRGRAEPEYIAGQVWAWSSESLAKAREALETLAAADFLTRYVVRDQIYFEIRNWEKHQKVDHPGKPRVPLPSDGRPLDLAKVCESLATDQDQDQDLRPGPGSPITLDHLAIAKRATEPADFLEWWIAYPRKVAKAAALKAWKAGRRGELPAMLTALEWQRTSDDWAKDGGRFIPHPATYLNQGRWNDEPRAASPMNEQQRRSFAAIDRFAARHGVKP